jgi:Uma2 family endonuclease
LSDTDAPGKRTDMTDTATTILAHIREGQLVRTRLTLDEFLEHNPEEAPYLEYEGDGGVRRKMSPTTEHSAIAAWLGHRFLTYGDQRHRRIYAYVELRTNVGGESKVPDVAIYVDHRPTENERKQATVVADVSIEILSPGQGHTELASKCRWYIDHGGKLAMLVDPGPATVNVWNQWLSQTHYEATDVEPIDELNALLSGLELSAREIFAVLND